MSKLPITEDVKRLCRACGSLGYISAAADEHWHNATGTMFAKVIRDYMTELFNAKREQEQKYVEWIPVSERLPEKDGRYLVCMSCDYYSMDILMWTDGWNCYRRMNGTVERMNEVDGADIIAWMPLPEPYRMEQKNE